MNEPQSISAEILALSILAGENTRGEPLAALNQFTPVSLASGTLWPLVTTSSVFAYLVPQGHCLLITYLSLYTSLADESSLAVNYGFNYEATAQIVIQTAGSGAFQPFTGQLFTQQIFNHPILLVFEPDTTPRVNLYPNGTTQANASVRVQVYAHGFLLPAGLSSAYKPFQSRFVS